MKHKLMPILCLLLVVSFTVYSSRFVLAEEWRKVPNSHQGITVTEVTDSDELDKLSSEIDFPVPDGYKLTKVVVRNVVYANNSHKVNTFNNVPDSYTQPYFWGPKWEIRNFRKDSYRITYPNNPIRVSTYEGPATANMTISESASSSFTASTGVDLKLVEAKLGHTISQSVTVSDSFSVPVARGKILKVQAFVLYDQWRMDAYKDNKFVGTEFYHYPVGVSFKQYIFDKK